MKEEGQKTISQKKNVLDENYEDGNGDKWGPLDQNRFDRGRRGKKEPEWLVA